MDPQVWGNKGHDVIASTVNLQPGRILDTVHPIELPPLHGMAYPFWKNVREKMTEAGIECKLTLRIRITKSDFRRIENKDFMICTYDLQIMPRPDAEQKLLDRWLRDSPKESLPPVCEEKLDFKNWFYGKEYEDYISNFNQNPAGNFITIHGEEYDPQLFIRFGNRKPPVALCPRDSEGWKALEESLVPSTMRDEIRLTRMLIEYYERRGVWQKHQRNAIVDWLRSLPEPQRTSMASGVDSRYGFYIVRDKNGSGFLLNDLGESYTRLLLALSPMMSYSHRWLESRRLDGLYHSNEDIKEFERRAEMMQQE